MRVFTETKHGSGSVSREFKQLNQLKPELQTRVEAFRPVEDKREQRRSRFTIGGFRKIKTLAG